MEKLRPYIYYCLITTLIAGFAVLMAYTTRGEIGNFVEDSEYYHTAKNLLENGEYALVSRPIKTASRFSPGFSLLTAPFMNITPRPIALAKWINLICILFWHVGIYFVFKRFGDKQPRAIFFLLAAQTFSLFNSTTIHLSQTFLPDIFLNALITWWYFFFAKAHRNGELRDHYISAIFLGLLCLTKESFIFLIPIVYILLFVSGRTKPLFLIGPAMALVLAFILNFLVQSPSAVANPAGWGTYFDQLMSFDYLVNNFWEKKSSFYYFVTESIFPILDTNFLESIPYIKIPLSLFCFAIVVIGIFNGRHFWIAKMVLVSQLLFFMLVPWGDTNRFLNWFIPFLTLFFLDGASWFFNRVGKLFSRTGVLTKEKRITIKYLFAILFIFSHLAITVSNSMLLMPSKNPNHRYFADKQMIAFIRDLPDQAMILSPWPERIYIHSGKATPILIPESKVFLKQHETLNEFLNRSMLNLDKLPPLYIILETSEVPTFTGRQVLFLLQELNAQKEIVMENKAYIIYKIIMPNHG